ncbi:uncharacterized protein LTR77_003478 [Saxophila tyrrhenica]|uniref:Uncharacterized protein n=1 Tax=Saxophila tyrrhenica TaxID=1690608 RepID=A0AAV9PHY7_9PEZI|nr:hypothetical protein LTR77_003478 [Saxophila tyrrhenica]
MPAGPGDTHLVTLFTDAHYYFSAPSLKPQHHRFSRGSYLYLYHNASENRTKIEIANHAGTADQDAFSGSFDHLSRVTYSYKQPTLFSVTIDGGSIQGHDQWHLPSYNERNQQKYLYKINMLDLYLWTEKDASTFLGHLKSVVPAEKLEIKDAPAKLQTPAEHRDSMSPVVQQLEKTAIGAQFPPRAESTTSSHSIPGPPLGLQTSSTPAQPTPMAYNPAAPAAPEPIAYREKTPPPLDSDAGNGLTNPGQYSSYPQQQYANVPNTFQSSGQPTPQQSFFSGPPGQPARHSSMSFPGPPSQGTPPQRTASGIGSLPPPPPPPGSGPSPQPYNPSFAPPPGNGLPQATSPPPTQTSFNRQSSYGGLPGQTQYASYPSSTPSFGPSALASPGLPGTPGYQQHNGPPTPSAPPAYSSGPQQYQPGQQQQFGYSSYSYSQQQPADSSAGPGTYGIHGQVYRPTEQEALAHGKPAGPQRQQSSETRNRLEGRVTQVEAGVGKFMKRLDKLW